MEKFNSERIETLKCQFYNIMGQLEVQKNIVISDKELQIFEKNLVECESEVEAAGFILGGIRRYTIKLKEDTGGQIKMSDPRNFTSLLLSRSIEF